MKIIIIITLITITSSTSLWFIKPKLDEQDKISICKTNECVEIIIKLVKEYNSSTFIFSNLSDTKVICVNISSDYSTNIIFFGYIQKSSPKIKDSFWCTNNCMKKACQMIHKYPIEDFSNFEVIIF